MKLSMEERMLLWRITLYQTRDDEQPERWGLMVAASKDAANVVVGKMGKYEKAVIEPINLSEIQSIPEGTFFWRASDTED